MPVAVPCDPGAEIYSGTAPRADPCGRKVRAACSARCQPGDNSRMAPDLPTPALELELRATRWGAAIAPDQLTRAAAESTELVVPEGSFLCRSGEPVDAWFGVIDGLLKMMVA